MCCVLNCCYSTAVHAKYALYVHKRQLPCLLAVAFEQHLRSDILTVTVWIPMPHHLTMIYIKPMLSFLQQKKASKNYKICKGRFRNRCFNNSSKFWKATYSCLLEAFWGHPLFFPNALSIVLIDHKLVYDIHTSVEMFHFKYK